MTSILTARAADLSPAALGAKVDDTVGFFVAMLLTMPVRVPPPATSRRSASEVFAGFRFVRDNPLFLAAITLDLSGVLFGGAVALLPIFA